MFRSQSNLSSLRSFQCLLPLPVDLSFKSGSPTRIRKSWIRKYEADLKSMTAKGIKRICLELMELKKASDEDFQRNVYLIYSAFVRIFEEIGGIESEILELKKHASTQTKLIQAVMSNFYADRVIHGSKETEVDYLDLSLPNGFGIHMQYSLATLDILLSECQLEEALVVLEKEILTLQKLQIQENSSSPITMSYAYALSERSIALCEMIEGVGHEYVEEFFGCCESLLAQDGVFVLQFISIPNECYDEYRRSSDFIKEYIFPGGHLPSLSRITSSMAASSRLCVEHVENIGLHYYQTLRYGGINLWQRNMRFSPWDLTRSSCGYGDTTLYTVLLVLNRLRLGLIRWFSLVQATSKRLATHVKALHLPTEFFGALFLSEEAFDCHLQFL